MVFEEEGAEFVVGEFVELWCAADEAGEIFTLPFFGEACAVVFARPFGDLFFLAFALGFNGGDIDVVVVHFLSFSVWPSLALFCLHFYCIARHADLF